MRVQIEADEWEVHQLLRQRQLIKAGAVGVNVDFILGTLQAVFPEAPIEFLDPARPKPTPAAPLTLASNRLR